MTDLKFDFKIYILHLKLYLILNTGIPWVFPCFPQRLFFVGLGPNALTRQSELLCLSTRLGAHYADGFLAGICSHTSYCAIAGYMIVAGHGDAKGMESIHSSSSAKSMAAEP